MEQKNKITKKKKKKRKENLPAKIFAISMLILMIASVLIGIFSYV